MKIEKIPHLLPKIRKEEIEFLKNNSLNDYFFLHNISGETFFTPKAGSLYMVKEGGIIVYGYIDDHLEFHMDFDIDDCIGQADLFHRENIDFIIRGKPSALILEIPAKKIMEKGDIKFLNFIYEKMLSKMVTNIIKLFKTYAAKVNFSNEQYFINFLLNNGGSFTFTSTEELAYILHIELRTIQRVIKKLSGEGMVQKSKKTITITDMEAAKDLISPK